MSDQFPPQGPQGPQGPPPGPQGQPEYLSSGGGQPVGPGGVAAPGNGRKKAIIGGAVVGGLAIIGGAAYGLSAFMSSGADAAEALPAGTVGVVSVNLDPSGAQKIEAIKTLRKFPAFRDQVDLGTTDDLRKKMFEELQQSGACESVDYDEDVKPWLGDRMAVAAVDAGEEMPSAVGVLEVTDSSKAEDGLAKLQSCAGDAASGGGENLGGFAVEGDWVVIAETDEIAKRVSDDAAEKSLADDEDYQRWTDEAGDDGVVSMYAAPAAGEYLASQMDTLEELGGAMTGTTSESGTTGGPTREELVEMGFTDEEIDQMGLDEAATGTTEESPGASPSVPPQVTEAMRDFQGAAATIRFDDGALEVELAADAGDQVATIAGSDEGGDVVETLPEDTLMAFGVGFADDWFSRAVDQFSALSGEDVDIDTVLADLEEQTGLAFPEDAEALVGDSMAIAVGSDIDPEAIFNGGGAADIPAGIKIKGDQDEIDAVLAKLAPQMGEQASLLETEADGDYVALGANPDYRGKLAADGGLGDTDAYREVIEESDKAGALFFLNFDANGDWLSSLSADDPTIADNVEPLSAFGISGWVEDGVSHGLMKLTTD